MILREFKMIGMTGMQPMGKIGAFSQNPSGCDSCGTSPCGCDEYEDMPMDNDMDALLPAHTSDATPMMGGASTGGVSREDCCAAVMSLIECCSCEVTKSALLECCQDILSGDYDR